MIFAIVAASVAVGLVFDVVAAVAAVVAVVGPVFAQQAHKLEAELEVSSRAHSYILQQLDFKT